MRVSRETVYELVFQGEILVGARGLEPPTSAV